MDGRRQTERTGDLPPAGETGNCMKHSEDEEEGGGSMPVTKSLLCVWFLFLTYDGSVAESAVLPKKMACSKQERVLECV